jgi:heme A synthase
MNRRPLLSARDEAFIQKWRWRLAICYCVILLAIVLGGLVTPNNSAEQGFSSAAIAAGYPHPR